MAKLMGGSIDDQTGRSSAWVSALVESSLVISGLSNPVQDGTEIRRDMV